MAEFTKVLVFATARQTAGWYVYARISSFSFSARKALLAKAAATGVKFKLVYVPLGVAGGALGVVAGCLSFATGTIACVYSVGSAYALVQTGQIAWRDRFELGRQSLRDAAVFGIIATLNEQAEQIHETTRLQDLAEEEDV